MTLETIHLESFILNMCKDLSGVTLRAIDVSPVYKSIADFSVTNTKVSTSSAIGLEVI